MENDKFYGDSLVKSSLQIVRGSHEENIVNQISKQSPH